MNVSVFIGLNNQRLCTASRPFDKTTAFENRRFSTSEQTAGSTLVRKSKEKEQDKVGRTLNKKTFVYQYLLSRLLNGSLKQKNVSSFNNHFTFFTASSLFIPKIKKGNKKEEDQLNPSLLGMVGRDQVRNFFPYRKSFLCYWLFPFVGFVFTLGQKGEIQNANNMINYNFNLNSPNKTIYNIPHKSSKQTEDALSLYKNLKEDFYSSALPSFPNLNATPFAFAPYDFAFKTREGVFDSTDLFHHFVMKGLFQKPLVFRNKRGGSASSGEKGDVYNRFTTPSSTPLLLEQGKRNSLEDSAKLYQQCSLYLQSLENYLHLNTNLNKLDDSLLPASNPKGVQANPNELNNADVTMPPESFGFFEGKTNNKKLLSANINARVLKVPKGRLHFYEDSKSENYKPFLLKKPFWYEIPYSYFTSISEGNRNDKSSANLYSSLDTFSYSHRRFEEGDSQKASLFDKNEIRKFPLKLMVGESAAFFKSDFLSTYSTTNPVSSYLKASIILDNYAKNKSMQSLFVTSALPRTFGAEKAGVKQKESLFDKLSSSLFAYYNEGVEYDSFIETNLNLSSFENELQKRNVKDQAKTSQYSIVSSILSSSKEFSQSKFEGIWTQFLKTVTKNHIKRNEENLKNFQNKSSISTKNEISQKLSKETLYKLLFDSLQKSFFTFDEGKESMQRSDKSTFTEASPFKGQGETQINNMQIKLSHPILMSTLPLPKAGLKNPSVFFENLRFINIKDIKSALAKKTQFFLNSTAFLSNSSLSNERLLHTAMLQETVGSARNQRLERLSSSPTHIYGTEKEKTAISNKKQIKDFTFTRNALTGFSIDNSQFKETTKFGKRHNKIKKGQFPKNFNINEYLQYSTFLQNYAANIKHFLLKTRLKASSNILSKKTQSSMRGESAYSESARMEKLLRAYFSIKKSKVLTIKNRIFLKPSPFGKKATTALKWTLRFQTQIPNKFIDKNPILFLNNDHPANSLMHSKKALKNISYSKNRKLQNREIVNQFNEVYKHKCSPRLLIKNRSLIINNRLISYQKPSVFEAQSLFIAPKLSKRLARSASPSMLEATKMQEKSISSSLNLGVVIKPSSYFLDDKKLESYLSRFDFSNRSTNPNFIRKERFVKYGDMTNLKEEEQMNFKRSTQLEKPQISLKKWEYDKVDMSLETKRKYTQKKRRRKKLKKETRRRKKRKRFYPRPNWIRYRLYLKFLKKRYDKNSKTYSNTFSFSKESLLKSFNNEKGVSYPTLRLPKFKAEQELLKTENSFNTALTNNRPYFLIKNKESYADSSLVSLNPSKENFTISRVVLGDLKRVLWKSYWLRSNLNPYLKRVKTYLTEIKESTQRWEFFRNVNNLVNFLGGFISPYQKTSTLYVSPLEIQELSSPLPAFDSKYRGYGEGEGLYEVQNYTNFSKWEKSLYLSEYNRITYQRIQEFLSQIRENFAAIQGSTLPEGLGMGRNSKGKSRSASSATHISHLNLQDNKREAVLSKRKSTDFWVKLGKTLMAESYAQSTLLKKSWLFKEPTLPQLRMYWAFSKTSYGSFKVFNKRKETWSIGKKREQTKYNKTKKIYRDLSLKLQTLLNEQYELWTSWNSNFHFLTMLEPAPYGHAFKNPFGVFDRISKGDSRKGEHSPFVPKVQANKLSSEVYSPLWPLVLKNALKKARLKEEKSTFLFNKSASNNKYKYQKLNTLTLHQYKKNIQLQKLKYNSSYFKSPLTIYPTPSAWSAKLTNKSSYWWSDALTAKGFMPLELAQLQFLNKFETSSSLRNSYSYLPPSQAFPSLSSSSYMTYRSENVKGDKKAVTSLFDYETKALKISALLFHFCSIISLISISQIRDLFKFYLLGISKIYKSSIGILGFSFDLFSRKEITSSFGKGSPNLNKKKKQHFFDTQKSAVFFKSKPLAINTQKSNRNNLNQKLRFTSSTSEVGAFNIKDINKSKKTKSLSLQFLNKVNSLIHKSFNIYPSFQKPSGFDKVQKKENYDSALYAPIPLRAFQKSKIFDSRVQAKTYNQLSSAAQVEQKSISFNYQKSSPYANVKELKTISKNRSAILKTYTTLYSLIFLNFVLENINGVSFQTNRLFKQTFEIFGRFGPRSLFNFLEKPGELIGDWIAYMFLVEWASDMTNTIPENVDVYLGTTTLKATRTLHGVNLFSISQNFNLNTWTSSPLMKGELSYNNFINEKFNLVQNPSLLSLSPFSKGRGSADMENFLKNISILNIGSTFIQRRIYHLYEILLQRFYQPDTDLIVRQKKGVIFWDIWGDFLMQVAEDSNINISELTSLKEEQIKLFEKAQESFTIESPQKSNLAPAHTSFKKGEKKVQVTQNGKELFRLFKGVKGVRSFVPLMNNKKENLDLMNFFKSKVILESLFQTQQKNSSKNDMSAKGLTVFDKEVKQSVDNGFIDNSYIHKTKQFVEKAKLYQAQQFLSYQGKDTELFIDLHPPKSFSMVSFLKRNESVQHPIGSLVCQIFAGIMSKQISKNILVVGPSSGSSIGRDGGAEKTLLIQAIAGETEFKIITDNAYRYAMVYRGVAVGIKLLRDVFDSLALHTPCLFLIEDIHAIGERRPLLISDDENTKGAESNSFGSQREEIHEKNQVLYQLSKHVITHYRKPYKGDFSMLIPTNHFCFDLFRRNTGFAGNYPSKKQNFSFNAPRISIKSEKDQSSDSQTSSTSLSTQATVPSRLLVKSSQLFAPPATSPFSVLTLKEEKKFKPYKMVSEMPWGGLPGEQLAQVSKSSYSVRVKVALLADMAISTLSVKLDMITDLLVIIDSVKGNRGFVVFATTHVPYILDPALRRPGRLDETITLGLFPSILSRWEILKSSFGLFTAGKEQTGFNKGLSLDLTYSITFGHHPNRPSLLSNREGNSQFSQGNGHMTQNSSFAKENEITQFSNNIQKNLKMFVSSSPYGKGRHSLNFERNLDNAIAFSLALPSGSVQNPKSKIFESAVTKGAEDSMKAKNSSLTHPYTQGIVNKKALLSPELRSFYSRSTSFPSLLFFNSSENVANGRKINKESSNIKKIQIKRNIYSILKMSNASLPISNTRTSSYKGIKMENSLSLNNKVQMQNKRAPFDVNQILSQTYFYASVLLYEASINRKNSPQFLDTPSSLFVTNQTSPLSLYVSLYASPQQFKAFIVNFISGKLGEMLLFSGIRPSSLVAQNKEAINGFNSMYSPLKGKGANFDNVQDYMKHTHLFGEANVGVYTSYGLSSTWKALSSLVISFVQKRFLYHSNLIVPKVLNFNNQTSLLEPPSPPSSNILLPARRYENYKRSFSVFSGQQISKKVGIMDKIQAHQQQRLIKRLYGFPVQESFRSEVMENRSTSFSNASLMIGSFSSVLQKPSNSNWFVKNRILMRHKNYLTNQWWNGQLSEHNAETTFLSDIDWRSTFVESIGDLILDFPDADQHYNPRNRRWLLTKGSYNNWFDFDKTIYSEIYSHFIFDSFVKAYYIYEQNREVLDFYAYYVLQNGLHNVLNEFEILKLYKRFGALSNSTP